MRGGRPIATSSKRPAGRRAELRGQGLLALKLGLSGAALTWETLAPRFWPVVALLLAFLGFALLGIPAQLPAWLHLIVLIGFAAGFVWTLWRAFRGWELPDLAHARRRLEIDSGLAHRPLTAIDDSLATTPGDRAAAGLWEINRKRQLEQIGRLRAGPPRPVLAKVDPLVLRCGLLLLLVIAFVGAGPEWRDRLRASVIPGIAAAGPTLPSRIDAWINPPAYTGLPPQFLGTDQAAPATIATPVGSTILAQVQGSGGTPGLAVDETRAPFTQVAEGVYKISQELTVGTRLAIVRGDRELAAWPLEILPDAAPEIEFLAAPGRTERSALRIELTAQDDYGLSKAQAVINRIDQESGEPLVIELPLAASDLRDVESSSFHDLTPHPWAGLAVEIQLVALDALSQEGRSEVVRTVLPERIFNHPVARALVELRRQLTLEPDKRFPVARGLAELYGRPQHFFHDLTAALAMMIAERRLILDKSDKAIKEVQALLWETALRIEEGELATAEADLRELQEALMRALAEGASDEEIEQLMDELREALDRFLEALAERMSEQMAQGAQPQPMPQGSEMIESQALREMLERARELARSGARDAARDLLSQLQNILENMRTNPFAQMMDQEGQNAWEMMRDMEELMRRQQELLDRSYERSQSQQRGTEPSPQGEGSEGRTGAGSPTENQLDAQSQEAIRRQLGEMMRQLGEMLGDIPRPFGRAEQAMRDARDALSQDQPLDAIDPQSRALDQLQQGMQSMADSFMERMGQSQARRGNGPVGAEPGSNFDPLGRNRGQNGLDQIEGVEIPDEMELQRARSILKELRKRRGETSRPNLELDYIDRLLQQF